MIKKLLSKISWSNLMLEVFSVILAILLALWVNQYQQQKEQKENANIQLKRITKEVKRNLNSLYLHNEKNNERLSYSRKLINDLKGKSLDNSERIISLGYSFTQLENTEWEVAKLTGTIAQMEADTISVLSQIYLAQKLYGNHWAEFIKQFASGNIDIQDRKETDKYLGAIQFSTMTSNRLIGYYDQFIEHVSVKENNL